MPSEMVSMLDYAHRHRAAIEWFSRRDRAVRPLSAPQRRARPCSTAEELA